MDDSHDGPYAREPQIEDVVRICRALNSAGARYVLIGGFAVEDRAVDDVADSDVAKYAVVRIADEIVIDLRPPFLSRAS